MIPVRAVTTTSRAAAAPKQVRTKAVLSPLFLRFRTDNERTSNGGVVFRDGGQASSLYKHHAPPGIWVARRVLWVVS